MRPMRVQVEARRIAADLAIARSKLKALVLEIEEEAAGIDGRVVTRGKRKVEAAGQESQAELTRFANIQCWSNLFQSYIEYSGTIISLQAF